MLSKSKEPVVPLRREIGHVCSKNWEIIIMAKEDPDLWGYEPSTDVVRDVLAFVETWNNTDCSGEFAENFLWMLRDDAEFLARFCLIMFQLSDEKTLTEILVFLAKN
jgi:hypothetical protein